MPIIEIFKRRGKVTSIDSTPAPAARSPRRRRACSMRRRERRERA